MAAHRTRARFADRYSRSRTAYAPLPAAETGIEPSLNRPPA
jgi:hypothetical protein